MNLEEFNNKLIILEKKIKKIENLCKLIENKDLNKIEEKIHALEIRIKTIEIFQGGYEQNWKTIGNFLIQLVWVIMAAYILFKLGIQPPI